KKGATARTTSSGAAKRAKLPKRTATYGSLPGGGASPLLVVSFVSFSVVVPLGVDVVFVSCTFVFSLHPTKPNDMAVTSRMPTRMRFMVHLSLLDDFACKADSAALYRGPPQGCSTRRHCAVFVPGAKCPSRLATNAPCRQPLRAERDGHRT